MGDNPKPQIDKIFTSEKKKKTYNANGTKQIDYKYLAIYSIVLQVHLQV